MRRFDLRVFGWRRTARHMQNEKNRSLSRFCSAIGAAVFVVSILVLIAPALAQQTSTTPKISCHLMRVEGSAEGIFTVANLDRIRLEVEIDGREWAIERLKISGVQDPLDDPREPNVKVTVDSLSDTQQDIPVRISPFGGGRKYNTHTISTVLEIPISEEEKRAKFDQYFLRVLENFDPNDLDGRITLEFLKSKKEYTYLYLRGLHFEHKPGLYRITCSYRSFNSGFWNGEIYSDPILVQIEFEKSFYDQIMFLPN